MTKLLIDIKNCSKVYVHEQLKNKVIDEISLKVALNQSVAIMGPSGSGKSTFLNIISTLDEFDTGTYKFDNKDIALLSDKEKNNILRTKIAIVNQNYDLFESLTVFENIELIYSIQNVSVNKQKIISLLKKMELYDYKECYPNELSGGQKQRVNIIRALCKEADLILLDEPTASLDFKSSIAIIDYIKQIESTKICMTHNPRIASMFDRVLFLENGKICHELWQFDDETVEQYSKRIGDVVMKVGNYDDKF